MQDSERRISRLIQLSCRSMSSLYYVQVLLSIGTHVQWETVSLVADIQKGESCGRFLRLYIYISTNSRRKREKEGGNLWLHFLAHQDRSWCLIHFFFSSLPFFPPFFCVYTVDVWTKLGWCGSSRLLPHTSLRVSLFCDRQKNILDGCCLPFYFCSLSFFFSFFFFFYRHENRSAM